MSTPIGAVSNQDPFRQLALKIQRLIDHGPGSPHARVEGVREMLIEVARENYEAGQKAAAEELAKVAAAQSLPPFAQDPNRVTSVTFTAPCDPSGQGT